MHGEAWLADIIAMIATLAPSAIGLHLLRILRTLAMLHHRTKFPFH
ncbi:hypothetical protein [Bradyrhizobium sp. SZCCHNR1051]|nr:hypothetical protein [Bradyrhizobium sp. SZCCHNR1051]